MKIDLNKRTSLWWCVSNTACNDLFLQTYLKRLYGLVKGNEIFEAVLMYSQVGAYLPEFTLKLSTFTWNITAWMPHWTSLAQPLPPRKALRITSQNNVLGHRRHFWWVEDAFSQLFATSTDNSLLMMAN